MLRESALTRVWFLIRIPFITLSQNQMMFETSFEAAVLEASLCLVLSIMQFVIKKMKCIFRESTTRPFCWILPLHFKHCRHD